jgi:hypothetical protein
MTSILQNSFVDFTIKDIHECGGILVKCRFEMLY